MIFKVNYITLWKKDFSLSFIKVCDEDCYTIIFQHKFQINCSLSFFNSTEKLYTDIFHV